MEYDWAVDGKKPRLMFVAPDSFAGAAPASDGDAKARSGVSHPAHEGRDRGSALLRLAHALSAAVLKALSNELLL